MDTKELIKSSQEYVKELGESVNHLLLTGECVKDIDSTVDDTMIIACLLHDIERAFKENRNPPVESHNNWNDEVYCLWHGARSAEFASEFLRRNDASEELISKVTNLIIHHELGGTEEQNLIKDADSLSFLQTQVDRFISKMDERGGKESIRNKFNWMYERISSEKAKELAKPFYEKAIEELNNT